MEQQKQLVYLRASLGSIFLLSALALYGVTRPAVEAGVLFSSRRWMAGLALGILLLAAELGLFVISWTSLRSLALRRLESGLQVLSRLRAWNWVLLLLGAALYIFLLAGPFSGFFEDLRVRLFVFWIGILAGSVLLRAAGLKHSWVELLAASTLFLALIHRAAGFLPDISTYPFSLNWSEASRYYYASLYFSERIYGLQVPPTVLHPSRYLMQAVPFLLPDSPLWLHRAWQVFLWIATTGLTAFFLARRLALPDRLRSGMLFAWAFLFLLVGPVYYHLQIPVILVLWGFSTRPASRAAALRSIAVLLVASAWAGISRVNWYPVPAMLAAALYFLEVPKAQQPLWRYLAPPFAWGVTGGLVAIGTQALYVLWSGNEVDHFTSSFTSDLLWYRLFPNPTYPPGILLDSLVVSMPLFFLMYAGLAGRLRRYHSIRYLGLAAILLILYAGGLVVSVKIGGGSNLHNLDAYLALLMVIAAWAFFGRAAAEPEEAEGPAQVPPAWLPLPRAAALALVVFIPIYAALPLGGAFYKYDEGRAERALAQIKDEVDDAQQAHGRVLFLAERQLLTFGQIEGVPLEPDYERVFMMEMAMAGNPDYLGRFHEELKNQEYALIVSEPLFIRYKGAQESFGEENDAWVDGVSRHVLCYYEPDEIIRNPVRLQLFKPREKVKDCP